MKLSTERALIHFHVSDAVLAGLERDARRCGRPVQLHAKLLLEAAYAVRVKVVEDKAVEAAIEERLADKPPAPALIPRPELVPSPAPSERQTLPVEEAVSNGGGGRPRKPLIRRPRRQCRPSSPRTRSSARCAPCGRQATCRSAFPASSACRSSLSATF